MSLTKEKNEYWRKVFVFRASKVRWNVIFPHGIVKTALVCDILKTLAEKTIKANERTLYNA